MGLSGNGIDEMELTPYLAAKSNNDTAIIHKRYNSVHRCRQFLEQAHTCNAVDMICLWPRIPNRNKFRLKTQPSKIPCSVS